MTRVYIDPKYSGEDRGDGGIRRVVEAQTKYLPQYGVEVVEDPHSADVLAFHAGTWINPLPHQPVVAHCHGLYWEGYEWPKWATDLNQSVIRTMKQADVVTAPSRWVKHALDRGMWADARVLYHGIYTEDWLVTDENSPHAPGEYVLWNKTRVDPICDPTPVNELAKLAPEVPFKTTYGRRASNVEVTGSLPYVEAKQLVQRAGVYLCTSRETFGIGTLEAMAAGVPVLGWNFGGQAEFVSHKTHGYLAKLDDYGDLLVGLYYCLKNRAKLGKAARNHVFNNFTWEKRVQPYAELYKSLCETSRDRPKVSVVMPYYNLSQYVDAAVNSVVEQSMFTRRQAELVIVDDASPQPLTNHVQDLAENSNGRIQIVRHEKNKYLAETLNDGIAAARGKYIIPLDADNTLGPGALETLAGVLDNDRALDIAYGRIEFVPEKDPSKRFISSWPPDQADLFSQLQHRNQISSTAMFRRSVFERVGGYRRRCRTAEDADFWTRALALGFVGRRVTDAVTLVYNDRDDGMSHVQKDWAWHKWYPHALKQATASFVVGGAIHAHERPNVSVVIPVGPGHERLVLDALDSLQAQSFPFWEAIVVNDTDTELPWVPPWATVLLGTTTGAAKARNYGLAAARGEYVLFLDADDYLHPEALRVMVHALEQGRGAFAYSDWFKGESGEVYNAPEFDPTHVLQKMPYPVTCMYRRSELLENDLWFDGKLKSGWEDWDFAIQVVAKAGLCGVRVPAPLFHYRYATGTLRETAYKNREELKKVVFAKWRSYIKGEEKNMAGCRCGGRPAISYGIDPATTQANLDAATTQLEYTATEGGSRSFVGRVTGNRYRFDTVDQESRVRRVYNDDVPWLLSLGYFREYTGGLQEFSNLQPLEAAGPPTQGAAA